MKKIKSLFKRDYEGTHLVYNEVVEGCEWVINGEGIPTQKWDGTCCMIKNGVLYKRYDRKLNKSACSRKKKGFKGPWTIHDFKDLPKNWTPAQMFDPVSGHWPGWLPVGEGPEDKYFREALESYVSQHGANPEEGTYELIGEKVGTNDEQIMGHVIIAHGEDLTDMSGCPRDFDGIKEWLEDKDIEGVVWHHKDGRMCKIKKKDFGLTRRPIPQPQ